jgi:type IV pilus assembly protein PilB
VRQKKRLGDMLIEAGLLTEPQLQNALSEQKKADLKLGQYLVREGIINETQIVDLLSRQLKLRQYRPDLYPLDMSLTQVIPHELARKHDVVPLKDSEFLLTVATSDPMDLRSLDAIEAYTNREVEPVICTEQELGQLLDGLYGAATGLDTVLNGMDQYGGDRPEATDMGDLDVSSLQGMAEDAPVVRLVNSILSQAVREGASDIHMSPERDRVQVRFRVDGRLREVPSPPKTMFMPIVSRIKILANMDIANTRVPQDGRFSIKMAGSEINARVSTLPTIYGENLVLRLLTTSSEIYELERMGMSRGDIDTVLQMVKKPYGMILSTGPTGSGKSTTLYALLKTINRPDVNIITLEDPVEYRMKGIRQVQLNRKAGMTFASGLRSILRQDPDTIMVGEIRDRETATIAVQAAMTGHLVLSTVHTNDAAGAVTRFVDMGIEPFLVSSVMVLVIAQRLVRTVCPHCKAPDSPPEKALAALGIDKEMQGAEFSRGKGCFNCMDTGFKGRTGLFEVLAVDETIQEMIVQGKSSHEIARAARETGQLKILKEDAAEKVLRGVTTVEEAMTAVMY